MNKRAYALDALRGYAIISMVLSGAIVFGILPGWMYHAQEQPPTHVFNPDLPGITWVDLVFPFFLFAMGAAFPFSVGKRIERGEKQLHLVWDAVKRGLQLTFFAIFIQHFYPWSLSNPEDMKSWLLSLTCFALLFPMFMRIPLKMPDWAHLVIKMLAYLVALALLITTDYAGGKIFNLAYSNIIILVLANMSVFGTLIYIFTANKRWVRIAILPFIMAVFLGSKVDGSWTQALFNFSPFPWMYNFMFLKYLFIVIPGSIAGEYLLEWMNNRNSGETESQNVDRKIPIILLFITIGLIVLNLCCLYSRLLVFNLFVTSILIVIGYYLLRNADNNYSKLWKNLFIAGAYLLLLGLFFEAYEGGIKKDHSTYSYYFVTSGLASMALLAFNIICDYYGYIRRTRFLVMSGQNPMIAYVTTNLFTVPLLSILGVYPLFSYFSVNPWLGFLRGVIITIIAILITMFFTRIKWFWRT
jgi:Uncharacterized conserved protein